MRRTKKGRMTAVHHGPSIAEVFNHVHREIVRHCEYCGKPMTRSEVNDFGSLCESCYMKEYYGEQ